MGFSQDYSHVPDWVEKPEGYQTGAMVKYEGNVFIANFWASKPGEGDPNENGWRLHDELYDVTSSPADAPTRIIGYIPTWRKKEGFDYANAQMYRNITHGIISFLMFSETNLGEFEPKSVEAVNAILADVVLTGHDCGTYISIALGGAVDYGFLYLMERIGNNPGDPVLQKAVKNVVDFVEKYGLDGVDLDLECWWDKNNDANKDQGGRLKSDGAHPAGKGLTEFAKQLKQAMPDKIISAALFATSWYGNCYDPGLVKYVDWLGIMTYDLTGSWNQSPVGPQSALLKIREQEAYAEEQQGEWPGNRKSSANATDPMSDNPILSVEDSLWYWTNPFFTNWQGKGQNLPRNMIAAGVPIYGYDFAYGKEPDDLSGQVAPGYKTIRYKDLLSQFPNADTAANGNIKVPGNTPRPPFVSASGTYPYAHNIYFETPKTATDKLNFLKSVGAQGVIIWELSNDVWEGNKRDVQAGGTSVIQALDVWEGNKRDVQAGGTSVIQALYQNSGNPATRPVLPSKIKRPDLEELIKNRQFPQTDWLSVALNEKELVLLYDISAEPYYQWWVLYRGVMPDWDDLNKNKEKWDWFYSNSETNKEGSVKFDYNFTPGAIYTLALFKDQTKDAYDLADYVEFRLLPQDDTLSNLNISGKTFTFDYQISAEPYYQWWVLYRGVMPDWDALNKNKEKWDWVYSQSETDKKGTVKFDDYNFTPGAIYTLALFKDQTKDAYDLADYLEFIAFQGDNSSDLPAWIEVHGDNSYCYCACNSATDNKHRHASRHTMNVKAGAPYFYAVLTKDDDSIDFPTGVILEIQRPDGSYIHRHDKQENQLVSMAGGGSSVHCLIVKDPMPGDWKMTMTVPEGVGFHCECNTVPSKDPYKTITTTLTPNLNKRGLDNDVTIAGWLGAAATGATIGAVIGTAVPGVGTFIGGFVGAVVGNITSAATHLFPPSPTSTLQTATNLGYASQTFSVSPTPQPSRQQGRYNLLMEERPNTIYPNLVNFNTDLTRTGNNRSNFPVEMTRHHIIPYNQLRRFWNTMVQEGHLRNAAGPLFGSITDLLEMDVLITNFTLNQADREQVIQLLEDIRQGRVTHDANRPSLNGWDSLQEVYAWMPGNLFIGPSGNFRTDDPGEAFEGGAGVVVQHGFEAYRTANDRITQYENNHTVQLAQQIANAFSNINSRQNQPFLLNPDNWEQVNDNGRIRYRLKRS